MSSVGDGDGKNAEKEMTNVPTDEDEDFLLSLDQWDVVDEASGSEEDTADQVLEEESNTQAELHQDPKDSEKESDVQAKSDRDGCSSVVTENSKEDKDEDVSGCDNDQVVLTGDQVDGAEDILGTIEGATSSELVENNLGKNNSSDGSIAVAGTESSKESSESSVLVSNFSLWPNFTVTIQNNGKEAGEFLTTEEGDDATNTPEKVPESEGLRTTETLAVSADEVLKSTHTQAVVDKQVETLDVNASSTYIDFQDNEKVEANSAAGNVNENELLVLSELNDPDKTSNYEDSSETENINDNQVCEVTGDKDIERQISNRNEKTGQGEDDMEVENETKEEQMEVETEDTKMSSLDGTENSYCDETKSTAKDESKVKDKIGDRNEEHREKDEECIMEETENAPDGKNDDDIEREEDQKKVRNEDQKEGGVKYGEEKMEETTDVGQEEVEEIEDGEEELEGDEEEEQDDEAIEDKKEGESDNSIDESNQNEANKTEEVKTVEKAVIADKSEVEQTKGKLTKSVQKEPVQSPRKSVRSTEIKAGVKAEVKAEVKAGVKAEVKAEAAREITTTHVLDLKMACVTVDDLGSRDMILILKNALHFSVDFPGQPNSVKGIGTVTATISLDRRHTSLKYLMKNLAFLYFEGVQFPDLRQKYLECIGKECRAMSLQGIHPKQYSLFAYQLPKYTTREKLKKVFPNSKRSFLAYTRKGIGWAVLQFRTKEEPLRILQATGCEITLEKRALPTILSVVSLRSTEALTNPDFQAWFYDQKFNPGGRGWGPRIENDNSKENRIKEAARDRNRKESSLGTKQKLAYEQQLHKAHTKEVQKKTDSLKTAKLQKSQSKTDSPKTAKLQKSHSKTEGPKIVKLQKSQSKSTKTAKLQKSQAKTDSQQTAKLQKSQATAESDQQTAKLSTIVSDRKQGTSYVAPSVRCLISVQTNVGGQTAPSSSVKGQSHVSPNIEIQTLSPSKVTGQTATSSKVKDQATLSTENVKITSHSSPKANDQISNIPDVKTKSPGGVGQQKALEQETIQQASAAEEGDLKNNLTSQKVLDTDEAKDTKTGDKPTAMVENIEAEASPTESETIALLEESDKKEEGRDTTVEDNQVGNGEQAEEEPSTVKNEGVEELDAVVEDVDTEDVEDVEDQATGESEGLDDTGEKEEESDTEDKDVEELDTNENDDGDDDDDDDKLEAVEGEDEVELDTEDDDVVEIDAEDDDVVEIDAEDDDVVEIDAEDDDVVELDAEDKNVVELDADDEDVVEVDTGKDEVEADAEVINDNAGENQVNEENKAVKNAEESVEKEVDEKSNEDANHAEIAEQPTTQQKSGKPPRKEKTSPVRSSARSPLKRSVSRKAKPGLVKGEGAGAIYDNVSSCDSISPYDSISSDSEHDGLNRKESPRKKRVALKGDMEDAQLENDSISSDSLPPEDLKKSSKGGWDYMRGVWDSVSGESVASANSELSDISSKNSKEKKPKKGRKGKSREDWEDDSLSNVSDAESEGHKRLHSHKELSSKIHSALSNEKYKQSDSAMVALLRSALDVVVQSRERQSPSPPPKSSRVRTDPLRKYKHSPSPASYKRHRDSSPLRGRRSRSRSPAKKHRRSVTPPRRRSSPSPLRHHDSLSPKRLRESFSPQRRRSSVSPLRIRGSLSPRRSFQSPVRDNYGKRRTSYSPVQDDRYRQHRDSQISMEGVPRHGSRRHGLSPVSVSPERDRYGRSSFSPGTSEYGRNMLDTGGHYRQRSPSATRDTAYTRRRVSVSPVRTAYTRHRGSPSPERMASYRRARDSVSPVGRGYNRNRRSRSPDESERRYNRNRRLHSPGAREYDRSRRSPSEESRRYDQSRRSPYSSSRGYDHSRRLLSPDSRSYDQSRRSFSPRTRSYDRSRRSLSSARQDSYDELSQSSRSSERSYVRHRSPAGSLSDISQQSVSRSSSRSLSPISSRSRSPSVKRKHPYDDYAEKDAKKAKLNEPAAVPYTAPGYSVPPPSSVVVSSYYPSTGYQQTAATYSQHPAMAAPGHSQYVPPYQPPLVPPPPLLTQSRPPYMYSQPPPFLAPQQPPAIMPHQLQQPPPPLYMSMQQSAPYSSSQQPLVTVTTKKLAQPQRRQLIPVPEQGTQSATPTGMAVGIADPPRRILFVGDSLIHQLSSDFVGQKQNLNLHQREFQIHCVGKIGGQVGDLEPPALNHTMNEIQPHNVFIQCGGDDLDSPNFNQIMTCLPTQLVSIAQRLVDGFGVLSVGIMQILPRLTTKHIPCVSYNKGVSQVNNSIKSLCKNNDNIFFWNHKNLKNTDVTSTSNDGSRLTESGMVKYFRSVRGVTLFVTRETKKTNVK